MIIMMFVITVLFFVTVNIIFHTTARRCCFTKKNTCRRRHSQKLSWNHVPGAGALSGRQCSDLEAGSDSDGEDQARSAPNPCNKSEEKEVGGNEEYICIALYYIVPVVFLNYFCWTFVITVFFLDELRKERLEVTRNIYVSLYIISYCFLLPSISFFCRL